MQFSVTGATSKCESAVRFGQLSGAARQVQYLWVTAGVTFPPAGMAAGYDCRWEEGGCGFHPSRA